MALIISLCYSWVDIDIYEDEFYTSAFYGWYIFDEDIVLKEVRQFGFFYINKLFMELGFSFGEMRFISSTIMFLTVIYLIRKITVRWQYVVVLYAVYPFVLDLIQTRNFIIEIFLTLAIYMYAKEENRIKRVVKYVCTIVAGMSFHTMALIYLPALLTSRVNKIKNILFMMAFLSPFFARFIIDNNAEILLALGLDNTPLQLYLMYVNGMTSDADVKNPFTRFLRLWIMVVCFWGFIYFIDKRVTLWNKKVAYNNDDLMVEWKLRFIRTTKMMWKYSLWLLPVLALTPSMERVPRNLMLSFFISFALYIELFNPQKKLMLTIFIIITLFMYAGYYNEVGINFLHENMDKNYILE